MTDPLKKVNPGDPFRPAAEAWNAFVDTARAFRDGRPSFGTGGAVEATEGVVVRIRNDSGTDVDQFGVLAITGVAITPTDNLTAFRGGIVLTGDEPTTARAGKFAIAAEPIPDGQIRLAYIAGACVCRVIGSGTHADIDDGEYGRLAAAGTGHARILYSQAGTSERWAVVLLGAGGGGSQLYLAKADADIAKGASGNASLYEWGSTPAGATDTGDTVSVYARFVGVSENAWLILHQVTETYYEILEAECEPA